MGYAAKLGALTHAAYDCPKKHAATTVLAAAEAALREAEKALERAVAATDGRRYERNSYGLIKERIFGPIGSNTAFGSKPQGHFL